MLLLCTADWPSNCFEVGGGRNGPKYNFCDGCKYIEAMQCLSDLRENRTGSVPAGCRIKSLTLEPQPECCPQYGKKNVVNEKTAAYPQALKCLKLAGCGSSALRRSLQQECIWQGCNTAANPKTCD